MEANKVKKQSKRRTAILQKKVLISSHRDMLAILCECIFNIHHSHITQRPVLLWQGLDGIKTKACRWAEHLSSLSVLRGSRIFGKGRCWMWVESFSGNHLWWSIGILWPGIRVDILIKHLRLQGPNEYVERQARVGCESSDYICESLAQIYISSLMQVGVTGLGMTERRELNYRISRHDYFRCQFRYCITVGVLLCLSLWRPTNTILHHSFDPFCHPHMNVTAVRRTRVKAWSV